MQDQLQVFSSKCKNLLSHFYHCFYRTNWVKHNGIHYKLKAGVIVDVKHDLPVIGQIEEIFVGDNIKIFFEDY